MNKNMSQYRDLHIYKSFDYYFSYINRCFFLCFPMCLYGMVGLCPCVQVCLCSACMYFNVFLQARFENKSFSAILNKKHRLLVQFHQPLFFLIDENVVM